MAPDTEDSLDPPVLEPWLLKVLRDRPRLIDRGYRKQACDSMCEAIRERRRPERVADRAAGTVSSAAQETTGRVAKEVAEEPIRRAAKSRF